MFNVNESFPILLVSKININIRRYQVNSMGPMTTIVQQFFSSPDTLLSHVKIVILAVGTSYLCTGSAFNNIKKMNDHAKRMSGKKLLCTYPVKSNITRNIDKTQKRYYSDIASPNFHEILANGTIPILDVAIHNTNHRAPVIIAIPTCLSTGFSAKYIVNGQEVRIPASYKLGVNNGVCRHLNAFCELPAGTDRLKVELVGEPGTILSIRSIQVYQ